MGEYAEIALLAIIQGAAELLPVSSSAHVILAEKLMGRDPSSPAMTFLLVMLHTGTMFAVLFYFWPRWRALLFPAPTAEGGTPAGTRWHFVKMVILATACTGFLGLGALYLIENVILERMLGHSKGEVESLFKNLYLMAAALFTVGVLILAANFFDRASNRKELTPASSIWIGVIQGICLPFRGFSRSGATISVALMRGVARPLAEDFSFALAVVLTPPVLVRQVYRLLKSESTEKLNNGLVPLVGPGLLGMVFSCLAGLAALKLLSAVLEQGRWWCFGVYCLVASVVVFGAAWYGL
jgi:undecaprenyl-diphosphatase